MHPGVVLNVLDEPQGVGRGHEGLSLATLILPQTIKGGGVANGNFHSPALAVLVHDVLETQGKISGEKGLDRWQGLSLPSLVGGCFGLTA
jgi:hypothetical protein